MSQRREMMNFHSAHLPTENKGFAPQIPENDQNDNCGETPQCSSFPQLRQRHGLEKAGRVLP